MKNKLRRQSHLFVAGCLSEEFQYRVRGGNANNSATVVARLGLPAQFLGVVAAGQDGDWIGSLLNVNGATWT